MDDEVREKVTKAASEACRQFMCRVGEKYPWLHPDFDPANPIWNDRARNAYRRLREGRGRRGCPD